MPLSFAFSLALSMACGTISTPRTNFAFWARNREIVPIPQYRSQTVSFPVRPAYSRAFPYSFSVWMGLTWKKGQGRDLIGNISDAVRYIGLSPKEAKLITQDHIVPFFINIDGNAGHFRNFTE